MKSAHLNLRFASRLSIFEGIGLTSCSNPSIEVESAFIVAKGTYCAAPDADDEGNAAAGFLGCFPIIQSVSCPVETAIWFETKRKIKVVNIILRNRNLGQGNSTSKPLVSPASQRWNWHINVSRELYKRKREKVLSAYTILLMHSKVIFIAYHCPIQI